MHPLNELVLWTKTRLVFLRPNEQISYQSIASSDPGINVPGPRRAVSKLKNETYHMFSNLHPGTTYLISVRARTAKGFGQTALKEITTNISGARTAGSLPQLDLRLQRWQTVDKRLWHHCGHRLKSIFQKVAPEDNHSQESLEVDVWLLWIWFFLENKEQLVALWNRFYVNFSRPLS